MNYLYMLVFTLFLILFIQNVISSDRIITLTLSESFDTYDIILYSKTIGVNKDFEIDMSLDFMWSAFKSFQKQNDNLTYYDLIINSNNYQGCLCSTTFLLDDNEIVDYPLYYVNDRTIFTYDSFPLAYHFGNESRSFVHYLYNKKIIDHRSFLFFFDFPKQDAVLHIGGVPDEIKRNKYSISIDVNRNYKTWGSKLNLIRFEEHSYTANSYVYFQANMNGTYVPLTFMYYLRNTLFAKYLQNKECVVKSNSPNFEPDSFYCNCTVVDSFPNITIILNGIEFVFTKDELFQYRSNRCYFSMKYDRETKSGWVLGISFLSKYLTYFNYDTDKITFYGSTPFVINKEYYTKRERTFIISIFNVISLFLCVYSIALFIIIRRK